MRIADILYNYILIEERRPRDGPRRRTVCLLILKQRASDGIRNFIIPQLKSGDAGEMHLILYIIYYTHRYRGAHDKSLEEIVLLSSLKITDGPIEPETNYLNTQYSCIM